MSCFVKSHCIGVIRSKPHANYYRENYCIFHLMIHYCSLTDISELSQCFIAPGVSSFVNENEPNIHLPFSLIYTSVTINGLVTSFPPTTASKVILFNRMAVLSIMFTEIEWISAFLYQIPPLFMTLSSGVFPQLPPI